MYYRGANAALLLYDITNASSFEDVRGWLEGEQRRPRRTRPPSRIWANRLSSEYAELKKNCSPDLIIYIVGAKADLVHHRQVTSDLARLSLHTWFPPPRPPTPPAPPPPPTSTFSYIRPRFTSFTSIRSVPALTPPKPFPPPLEPDVVNDVRSSGMKRSNTQAYTRPRAKSGDLLLPRSNSVSPTSRPAPPRAGYRPGGWNEIGDGSSNSLPEDEEAEIGDDDSEWGLHKGMELFEVSAKDDFG